MKQVRALEELVPLIHEKLKAETSNIVEIGNLLLEARSDPELGHGRWLAWLNENFAMSVRTAENYMGAATYAKEHRLKIATVANMSARLLYALAQGRHDYSESVVATILKEARTKRVGIGRANTLADEEVGSLAAAAKQKAREIEEEIQREAEKLAEAKQKAREIEEARREAEDILGGPPPELPPAPEPAVADFLLSAFETAVKSLRTLHTKPLSKFVGTAHAADDLKAVAEFLNLVAEAVRKRQAA
jgi:hypothetical protein